MKEFYDVVKEEARNYSSLKYAFKAYEDNFGPNPKWEDLTDERLTEYASIVEKKYSYNSCENFLRSIKTVLRKYAELVPSKSFETILYRNYTKETPNKLYLTGEELYQIYEYECEEEYDKEIKRLFLIMAFTGARKTDAAALTIQNINDKTNTLFYTTEKNGNDISIPVHPLLKELVRGKHSPKSVSNYQLQRLRYIAKKAGISGYTEDGELRCNKITFETALKSFATYMYEQNVPVLEIMMMMDRATRQRVRHYIVTYRKRTKSKKIKEAFLRF